MGKKNRKSGGPTRKPRHRVKIANKHMTKLAKRGKLTPAMKAKLKDRIIRRETGQPIRFRNDGLEGYEELHQYASDTLDDALPLDMLADDDAEAPPEVSSRLLKSLADLSEPPRKKTKKVKENNDDHSDETRTFRFSEANTGRALLPIKDATGKVLPRFAPDPANDPDDSPDEGYDSGVAGTSSGSAQQQISVVDAVKQPLSAVELLANRQYLLKDYRNRIGQSCTKILSDPQEHIAKMRELIQWASGEVEALVQTSVTKLSLASLLELFIDIIPGYAIRDLTEKEEGQQVKKDTKKLREFEEGILKHYKKYLQLLEQRCSGLWNKKSNLIGGKSGACDEAEDITSRYVMDCFCALEALCRLLESHPHFNFRLNIIQFIVRFLDHKDDKVRSLVGNTFASVFKADSLGEVSLDIARNIGSLVKDRSKSTVKNAVSPLHESMLVPFLSLRIKEVEKRDAGDNKSKKEKLKDKREKLQKLSRKERKYKKQLEILEKELREAEAEENANVRLRHHTEIMNVVFTTYFRVLKQPDAVSSSLLPVVLEGLTKFAHLINIDFFDDLMRTLLRLIQSGSLKRLESLRCIHCAFLILSGEGAILNIDPHDFYKQLYVLIPDILTERDRAFQIKQFRSCLECLDLMLNKRRKLVSLQRVAAFTKRLSLMSLVMPTWFVIPTISAVASYLNLHSGLECMLDMEACGSGRYIPDLDDPDHSGALSSKLFEIHLLRNHSNTIVRTYARYIIAGQPIQGPQQLPVSLRQRSPVELLDEQTSDEVMGRLWDVPGSCAVKKCVQKGRSKEAQQGYSGPGREQFTL